MHHYGIFILGPFQERKGRVFCAFLKTKNVKIKMLAGRCLIRLNLCSCAIFNSSYCYGNALLSVRLTV